MYSMINNIKDNYCFSKVQLRLSSPHNNLFRSVFKKLSEVYSIIFIVKLAFFTSMEIPFSKVAILESKETR